jgi:hypothetical protein
VLGEFSVKKFDTHMLLEFEVSEWVETASYIEQVSTLAHDMQTMNKGVTTIARIGSDITLILDGDNSKLDIDKVGEAFDERSTEQF